MVMLQIRKSLMLREVLTSDLGKSGERPITRAVALAVIGNPYAGRYVDDLTELFEAGRALGEKFMTDLVRMLPQSRDRRAQRRVRAWRSLHHPMLGKPMRAAVGGGKAVIPANVKVAAAGTSLDVPLTHKDDSWAFDYFDTITVTMPDAPKPDEIVVVMAVADGGRLLPRCGQAPR
jgi:hypothetical protein